MEIRGAIFQVRPPIFSRGVWGWILIKEMHSSGFEKYHISKFWGKAKTRSKLGSWVNRGFGSWVPKLAKKGGEGL